MIFLVDNSEKRSIMTAVKQLPPRTPSHRHAAPSGPWPWTDLRDAIQPTALNPPPAPIECPHLLTNGQCCRCWSLYPQSLFPNWTPDQVAKSNMEPILSAADNCVIHHVDVGDDGNFSDPGRYQVREEGMFWKFMQETKRPKNTRVRALFIENLSVPVMQMLGTKYKVEPFFWSSSVNWIPSRYQEDLHPEQGDHITITLTFPRATRRDAYNPAASHLTIDQVINTQSPLPLRFDDRESHVLVLDLLAIHMIRAADSSTIITYHPTSQFDWQTTSAASLHSRVHLAGQSVYWNNIFQSSSDPTFVLLTILWYALYAWDEALELLWEYICQLELNAITTRNMRFTQELHRIRAHLLHYASLLEDFRKSIDFVLNTANPAMDSPSHNLDREFSRSLLEKECNNLLTQIERLSKTMTMWDKRLKNVMNLVFSSVNIEDSKHMQRLTQATVRDSAAMKQISYLTMVFLPASFVATVFGMNVKEITPHVSGTLAHYAETAIPLTVVTIWVIIALQGKWNNQDEDGHDMEMSLWARLSWPIMYLQRLIGKHRTRRNSVRRKRIV